MINWVLGLVGVDPIDWQAGTWTSQIAISIIVTWRWTGYNALIYLAAHAGHPARAVRGGRDRRRQPVAAVPARSPSRCCARRSSSPSSLHDRRPAAVRRAAAVRPDAGGTGGSDRQYQTAGPATCTSRAPATASFGYALGDRLGDVPADHRSSSLVNFAACAAERTRATADDHRSPAHAGADRPAPRRPPRCAARRRVGTSTPGSLDLRRPAGLAVGLPALLVARRRLPRPPTRSAERRRRSCPASTSSTTSARRRDDANFGQALLNSLVVAGLDHASRWCSSRTLAGFAFAKLRFRGRNGLLVAGRRHHDGAAPSSASSRCTC